MDNTITRPMNENDKRYIDVELTKKRKKNYQEEFTLELNKHEKIATKNGLPFARHVARDEFTNQINNEKNRQLREFGEIREAIKIPTLDWKKYSDLKNFEVIEEGEVPDDNLSLRNPGLNVMVKKTVYKYKGFKETYRVMESGPNAIKRAQEMVAKSRS